MSLTAEQVALRVRDARRQHTMRSARSQQSAEGRIGASDLGYCRSYLKLMLAGVPDDPSAADDEKFAAFVGSAYGDRMEAVYKSEHPQALTQVSFHATFPSGRVVPCNADIIDPELNALLDLKTKAGLALVRADKEPDRQHRYQVATYLLGAIQHGLLKEGARAFLVYGDRSGSDPADYAVEVVVTDELIAEIDEFVGDAVYAFMHNTEAPKDRQYNFCEAYCSKFQSCRGEETFETGVVESEEAALALKVHLENARIIKEATAAKKQADAELRKHKGVILSDEGPYEVSTTIIGAAEVPGYFRKESERLNVRPKGGRK